MELPTNRPPFGMMMRSSTTVPGQLSTPTVVPPLGDGRARMRPEITQVWPEGMFVTPNVPQTANWNGLAGTVIG